MLILLKKSDFAPGAQEACRSLNQSNNRNVLVPYYIGKSSKPHFSWYHEKKPEFSGPARMASSGDYFVLQICLFERATTEESSHLEALLIVSTTVAFYLNIYLIE